MPTLYLGMDAEGLKRGKGESVAAMQAVQTAAASMGKAVDAAAKSNEASLRMTARVVSDTARAMADLQRSNTAFYVSSQSMTAGFKQSADVIGMWRRDLEAIDEAALKGVGSIKSVTVAVTENMAAVRASNAAFVASAQALPAGFAPVGDVIGKWRREATFAAAAQTAMNVAATAGTRIASGLLRALAITPVVALSQSILELTGNLISSALGFDKANDAAERYMQTMKDAATAAEEAARAQQTFQELGASDYAAASAQERIAALKRQLDAIAKAGPNQVFPVSDFEKFGVPLPNASQVTQTKYTATYGATGFAPPTAYEVPVGFNKMDAQQAFIDYIATLEAQTKAGEKAATEVGKVPDAVKEFVGKIKLFALLPPNIQGAYIGAKVRDTFVSDNSEAQAKAAADERLRQQTEEARMRMRLTDALEKQAEQEAAAAKLKQEQARAAAAAEARFNRSADGFASGFDNAANNLLSGMTSLGGAFEQFAQAVANQVLQQTAIQPASEAVGAGLATWLGGLGAARGYAFEGGMVHRFAYGDIFDSPTRFSFGGGRRGEMGEAGPEAVMPLRRGADGRLGVAAAGGGGTTINVSIRDTEDHRGLRRSARQAAMELDRGMRRR